MSPVAVVTTIVAPSGSEENDTVHGPGDQREGLTRLVAVGVGDHHVAGRPAGAEELGGRRVRPRRERPGQGERPAGGGGRPGSTFTAALVALVTVPVIWRATT